MAKAKMEDAVNALETIRNWTQAVYADLLDHGTSLASAGQTAQVNPKLTEAIEAVDAAVKAVGNAVTAASTANAVLYNPDLASDDKGKIKGTVSGLSSRVGKAC